MKLNITVVSLLLVLLATGITYQSEAAPWRGYHHRHGWYRPVPEVRVYTPPARVVVPAVVVGEDYRHGYYGYRRPYYRRYYDHRYHESYNHSYYRH